jgi:hypothetical protein
MNGAISSENSEISFIYLIRPVIVGEEGLRLKYFHLYAY